MMKFPPLLLGAALAFAGSTLSAAPLAADSRITAVTVYADRAMITRSAQLNLAATGVAEITFEKLPATVLDESLQVTGRGIAQTTLLDVVARHTYVDITPNERVKALEDELRALNRQDRTLADRATVVQQQRDYVLKIQNATTTPTKEGTAAPATAETWLRMLSFTEDQLARFAAELLTLETQREDLQAKRTAVEQQLNELRGQGGRSYKTVTVRLDAATAGQLDLTLRYAVPAASWSPSYDARVVSSDRAVQLGYFGLVSQNTGEDWNNVELTLSTARPSLGGSPPPLYPWSVDIRSMLPTPVAAARAQQDKFARERSNQAVNTQLFTSDLAFGGAMSPSDVAQTRVESQATSASFKVTAPVSVASDNAPQKVPVTSIRLAATPEYLAIPKQLKAAFLTAKVANASEFPLLAGPMNVFLDDTFVSTSSLRSVMPGEKFDLALGADDGIAVKRRLNGRFTEDTGVVTKGRRITYDVTLIVQNNKKTTEKIVVLDQVPVSRHEKIVVRILSPDEKEVKPEVDGTLKWTFELKAGEKRELPLKFSIEHPNDLPVTGIE